MSISSFFYLSTWNPGECWAGQGSLCQGATGITQINHLLTFFPNPHSFRTTPGECTRSQSSTRTGSLCLSGGFWQFRLPTEGGLRLGSRLTLRWRQHIWKQYNIKDQRNQKSQQTLSSFSWIGNSVAVWMGRQVQGLPILFLPSILRCISTYSRCQVLRSVAMNITWNGTEQSRFLPGCTYIYWKTAILKVSRELLCFALHWAVKLGTGCFLDFPNALRRSRRCCVQVLLVRVNDSTKAWCAFALRLREFTQVKTGILRETTGGLRSGQCLLILYHLVLSCNAITHAYIL